MFKYLTATCMLVVSFVTVLSGRLLYGAERRELVGVCLF